MDVADNPIGESNYFTVSGKWAVRVPEYRMLRSEPLEYDDGENDERCRAVSASPTTRSAGSP